MRILITGGTGFVGSNLAIRFKHDFPNATIVAFDNLRRRGSEINLPTFKKLGIEFAHGDIRTTADLEDLPGQFDYFIECSAEPSVHAGVTGSPTYVIDTNLHGTSNCLEFARTRCGGFLFLSTSRVYSVKPLRELPLREGQTRLELDVTNQPEHTGITKEGIRENFTTHLPRTFYGATKLASELLIQEYAEAYGLRSVINRCGVICGPGQFGKVDQGVFTLWVAHHYFRKGLQYTGFGGHGKQVRDLLHPEDLYRLLRKQMENLTSKTDIYNVGGGLKYSTSLRELTTLCQEATGQEVPMSSHPETNPVDVPYYVSDCAKVSQVFGWQPTHSVAKIVQDIHSWIKSEEMLLKPLFSPN